MEQFGTEQLEDGLKRLARSAVIVFLFIALSKIFTYLYRIAIARYFGPEGYGLFSLALMISGWFIAFSQLGLNAGMFRYISFFRGEKKINKIRYVFQSVRKLQFILSIILALVIFFSAEFISLNIFHNPNLTIFLKLFSIVIPLTVISVSILTAFLSYEKIFWHSFFFYFLPNILKFLALIALIIIGFKTNAIVFSYVLGLFLAATASYLTCRHVLPTIFERYHLSKKLKSEIFKKIFSYSWPLLFYGIISSIFHWTDSFIIGYFKTTADVGFYNVALNIALILPLTSELFLHLFFPLITKEYAKKNTTLIRELSKQVVKWVFILNLPIFILILIFPGTFINVLFGKQYFIATQALRFLTIGAFLSSLLVISLHLISMAGKTKVILFDIVSIAILNLFLNILLVQRYGINGVAAATMISMIILNLIFLFQSKYYLSITPVRRKMLRIAIISLIPTFFLVLIRRFYDKVNIFELIVLGSFFILFYIILIFLTGCLDRNDFMILRTVKEKFKRSKK